MSVHNLTRLTLLACLAFTAPALAQGPAAAPPSTRPADLADLLQRALVVHPSLMQSRANLEAARARLAQARAAYWPQINGSLGYSLGGSNGGTGSAGGTATNDSTDTTATNPAGTTTSAGGSSTRSNYTIGISLRQTIYDAGRTASSVTSAAANELQAAADYNRARQVVALGVKQAYYTLVGAGQIVAARQQAVSTARENLESVNARLRAGAIPRADLLQAQSDLAQAELAALQARNAAESARLTLAAALGDPALQSPLVGSRLDTAPVTLQDADLLAAALQRRPDLVSLRAGIRSLEQALSTAYQGYGPSIGLSASQRWSDTTFFPSRSSWSIGIDLNQPIFNGFATAAQIGEARARLDAARAQEALLLQTLQTDVRQALLDVRSAAAEITAAEAALAAAQANQASLRGQYRFGLATQLQVGVAQNALATAETNVTQARAGYLQALARLDQAVGRE